MIVLRLAPVLVVVAVLAACGGQVALEDGSAAATSRASSSEDSECGAAGGACLVRNPPGAKGQGPATCGQLGSLLAAAAYVDSPLRCNVGSCCVPAPAPVACLDFPDDAPKCATGDAAQPVTFASLAELQTFLRGNWSLCAFGFFPGGYTDIEGVSFSGSGDAFASHAITWLDGASECDIVNDDEHHRPTQLELIPASPGSDRWLVSFTMPSTGTQTIAGIHRSPPRIELSSGVVLERVSDAP
jgi:hypothetical protein